MSQTVSSMEALANRLRTAGISEGALQATLALDALIQMARRRAVRRELGSRALRDLKVELELAQFDVLVAIEAPANEFGADSGETMVSTVAERLSIDPSRASRVVSEMVTAGYARRAVSQADARRTILELTARGHAVVEAVREYKFLLMGNFLSDWEPEVLDAFVPLLSRYASWADHAESGAELFHAEIAALADGIARASAGASPALANEG